MVTGHPPAQAAVPGPGGLIYDCRLRHARPVPLVHSFSYRTWMWLVDLDALPRFRWPLRALARFEPRDHLGRAALPIRENVTEFLALRGIDLADGKVIMLAHARSLGYGFNSLTVYWCYRPDGSLACVLAEVHNTYRERHCYLLPPDPPGRVPAAAKEMYVSPFFGVSGGYSFSLPEPGERLRLTITLHHPGERPFVAMLSGRRRPGAAGGLLRASARQPCPALTAAIRIRIQALRLHRRGLPTVSRPRHQPQDGVW
jgi:DUF1365 family protein